MVFASESDLLKHLKESDLLPVYFLFGEQGYLKRLYQKRIADKAVPKASQPFNLTVLEGRSTTVDEIADSAEALPLMAQRRCVVVNDLEVDKLDAREYAKLEELLSSPPDSSVILFLYSDLLFPAKPTGRCKNFLALVEKNGGWARLDARSPRETERYIAAMAEKNGCSMAPDVCRYLSQRCSDDMQSLGNEVDKLCAWAGGRAITREDIDLCCIAVLDASVFDLAKLIIRGSYQNAMDKLTELLDMREEPVAILGALSASFIDLYRAKSAREAGRSADQAAGDFRYKGREFRIRNAFRDADRFPKAMLRRFLGLLAQADYSLKSSRTDPVIVLQETITRMFVLRQEGGSR
ncbi:MAG: DNA polymerase III subunit delta [Oscillospiraceae bacterium]|nr:DNA polymerase III subunit delta [Oscillospiraceae bacterium]